MENLLLFLANGLVWRVSRPRLKRYMIGNGCTALLHSRHTTMHVRYTRDGDKLLFNNYTADGVTYGFVCVQMRKRCEFEKSGQILLNFMSRVRKPLQIRYNTSADLLDEVRQLTVSDYWQDKAGIDWKVKGYSNGKTLALLYVKNINDASVMQHDLFLNGFRFSGVRAVLNQ